MVDTIECSGFITIHLEQNNRYSHLTGFQVKVPPLSNIFLFSLMGDNLENHVQTSIEY